MLTIKNESDTQSLISINCRSLEDNGGMLNKIVNLDSSEFDEALKLIVLIDYLTI